MTDSHRGWLQEIAKWKLEAADEDNSRYFYGIRDISQVQTGDASYVIGRKGSGKTAVAEHLRGLKSYDTFVKSLSFKNFPFNELYKLADAKFTSPSQYTTIWKYIIYASICGMMAENEAIDRSISSELAQHFSLDIERGLARSISKISDRGGGFTIFGSGANATIKSITIPNEFTWQERVDILEELVNTYLDQSKYYIIFDELDEDYKDVLELDSSSKYFDLLIGLFKAAHDIRRKVRRGLSIHPVIFLREDIYDLLRDNDKNKWRDSSITLEWSSAQLRSLAAFRLSRALDEAGPDIRFDKLIGDLFTADTTRAGGAREKRHVFNYIVARTLMRPRDVISYLRECAKLALDEGHDRLSPDMFGIVNKRYSARLRDEFVDEIQGAAPYINEVFEIISKMRKQIFGFSEFRREY
jgi:hypothetical protein